MNRPMFPAPRRRPAFVLLAVAGVLVGTTGCEQDDSIRGEGSIEVPAEKLKFQPTPKGTSKSRAKAARNP